MSRKQEEIVSKLQRLAFELETSIQILSRNFTHAIHDMRAPIVAIRGYTRMVLEGRAGPINEKQRTFLTTVAENTDKLVNLAKEIDYFRAEPSVRYLELDLKILLRECLRDSSARHRDVSIDAREVNPVGSTCIAGDEKELRSALCCFISQALRLSKSGDEVCVELTCENAGDVVVRISNRGTAVPDKALESLFSSERENTPESNLLPGPSPMDFLNARRILWLHACRVSATNTSENSFALSLKFPTLRRTETSQ